MAPYVCVFTIYKKRLLAVCTAAPQLRTQASQPTQAHLGGLPGLARPVGSAPSAPGRRRASGAHSTPGRGQTSLFGGVAPAQAEYRGMDSVASGGRAVGGPHVADFLVRSN